MSEIWAPTFTPTMEEFSDFSKYLESIQDQCTMGICKIVPPPEWNDQFKYNDIDDVCIPTPIKQFVSGDKGVYQLMLVEGKRMSAKEFKEMADKDAPTKKLSHEEMERLFWKNVRFNPPTYGADMEGSLLDEKVKYWNMNNLGSILGALGDIELPGITTPYLYFGMWKAMFAWHVEDMNLFSINYLHFGEPKSWYTVPPKYAKRLEGVAENRFPELHKACPEFLRHKTTLISPTIIAKHNIPIVRAIQEKGDIMITFPYAYHCGFNHGFNCAESVNFALESWIPYGKTANSCKCRPDTVSIDMDLFVQYYEEWKQKPRTVEIKKIHHAPRISNMAEIPPRSEIDEEFYFHEDDEIDWRSPEPKQRKRKKKNPKQSKSPKKGTKAEGEALDIEGSPQSIPTGTPVKRKGNEMNTSDTLSGSTEGEQETKERETKKRRTKKVLSLSQERRLREVLTEIGIIPDSNTREALAKELDWTPSGVYNWCRRKLLENPKLAASPKQRQDDTEKEGKEELPKDTTAPSQVLSTPKDFQPSQTPQTSTFSVPPMQMFLNPSSLWPPFKFPTFPFQNNSFFSTLANQSASSLPPSSSLKQNPSAP